VYWKLFSVYRQNGSTFCKYRKCFIEHFIRNEVTRLVEILLKKILLKVTTLLLKFLYFYLGINNFFALVIITCVPFAVTDRFPVFGEFGTINTPSLWIGIKQYLPAQNFNDIRYLLPADNDKSLTCKCVEVAFRCWYSVRVFHLSWNVKYYHYKFMILLMISRKLRCVKKVTRNKNKVVRQFCEIY
jgi:hypothetical protein